LDRELNPERFTEAAVFGIGKHPNSPVLARSFGGNDVDNDLELLAWLDCQDRFDRSDVDMVAGNVDELASLRQSNETGIAQRPLLGVWLAGIQHRVVFDVDIADKS